MNDGIMGRAAMEELCSSDNSGGVSEVTLLEKYIFKKCWSLKCLVVHFIIIIITQIANLFVILFLFMSESITNPFFN